MKTLQALLMMTIPSEHKLFCIFGPTASGKSALVRKISEKIGIELISADSMQVFRKLNIGTAKPDQAERNLFTHHLIDIRNPDERYSAGDFVKDCCRILEKKTEIFRIIAGGTGMYLNSLLKGIHDFPEIPDCVKNQIKQMNKTEIREKLEKTDPQAASLISPKDSSRNLRILSLCIASGKTYTSLISGPRKMNFEINPVMFLLSLQKSVVYDNIRRRTAEMFRKGWIEEVRNLRTEYSKDAYGFSQAIGYREISDWLDNNKGSTDELKDYISMKTCQYAKRQFTWYSQFPDAVTVEADDSDFAVKKILNAVLNKK